MEKYKKIPHDRAKPRSGQKMKGRGVETRVRKYEGGKKKKRLERLKQGQTEKREG